MFIFWWDCRDCGRLCCWVGCVLLGWLVESVCGSCWLVFVLCYSSCGFSFGVGFFKGWFFIFFVMGFSVNILSLVDFMWGSCRWMVVYESWLLVEWVLCFLGLWWESFLWVWFYGECIMFWCIGLRCCIVYVWGFFVLVIR